MRTTCASKTSATICRIVPVRGRAAGRADRARAARSIPNATASPSPVPRRRRGRSRRCRRHRDLARCGPRRSTVGVISGTNHGIISAPLLPGGVSARPPRTLPVQSVLVAHPLARERAVGEAGERHVAARRRPEDVTGAARIGRGCASARRRCRSCRAKCRGPRRRSVPSPISDARVVAGPRDDLRAGNPKRSPPVARQLARDRPRVADRRQPAFEIRRRRGERAPATIAARARSIRFMPERVTGLERRIAAAQQRRHERADQVNARGPRVGVGIARARTFGSAPR